MFEVRLVTVYSVIYFVVVRGTTNYGLYKSRASANARIEKLKEMGI